MSSRNVRIKPLSHTLTYCGYGSVGSWRSISLILVLRIETKTGMERWEFSLSQKIKLSPQTVLALVVNLKLETFSDGTSDAKLKLWYLQEQRNHPWLNLAPIPFWTEMFSVGAFNIWSRRGIYFPKPEWLQSCSDMQD